MSRPSSRTSSQRNSAWRNRAEFPVGRAEIVEFLKRKWARELDYRLIKELWRKVGRVAEALHLRLDLLRTRRDGHAGHVESKGPQNTLSLHPHVTSGKLSLAHTEGMPEVQHAVHVGVGKSNQYLLSFWVWLSLENVGFFPASLPFFLGLLGLAHEIC